MSGMFWKCIALLLAASWFGPARLTFAGSEREALPDPETELTESERYEALQQRVDSGIGQLVRWSEAIVEGEVLAVRRHEAAKDRDRYGRPVCSFALRVRVDRVVYGGGIAPAAIIEVDTSWRRTPPPVGFRGWLCLTRAKPIGLEAIIERKFSADDLPIQENAPWTLTGGERGCFAPVEANDEIRECMEAFYRWYRKKDIPAIEIALVLSMMSESKIERLKNDALGETLYFHDSLPADKRKELLLRADTPEWIRERFKQFAEHRSRSIRTRTRDQIEQMLREAGFYEAVESKNEQRIRMATINAFARLGPHELELYKDLWAPYILPLLSSECFDIKMATACDLAMIRYPDARVYETLIAAMRHPKWRIYGASDIQHATGKYDLPFDPEAPDDVREQQVRAWEEWWEREGRRKMTAPESEPRSR